MFGHQSNSKYPITKDICGWQNNLEDEYLKSFQNLHFLEQFDVACKNGIKSKRKFSVLGFGYWMFNISYQLELDYPLGANSCFNWGCNWLKYCLNWNIIFNCWFLSKNLIKAWFLSCNFAHISSRKSPFDMLLDPLVISHKIIISIEVAPKWPQSKT